MQKLPLLTLVALAVPAAAFASGVDLTWNDCVGAGNTANDKTFLCTGTQNQSYNLVVQFTSPIDLPAAAGVTAIVDLETDQGAVPLAPFWRYDDGGCQRPVGGIQGVAMFDDIRLLPGCAANFADLWDGDGSGGLDIAAYGPDLLQEGRERIAMNDGRYRYPGIPLTANINYYAFHLTSTTAIAATARAAVRRRRWC